MAAWRGGSAGEDVGGGGALGRWSACHIFVTGWIGGITAELRCVKAVGVEQMRSILKSSWKNGSDLPEDLIGWMVDAVSKSWSTGTDLYTSWEIYSLLLHVTYHFLVQLLLNIKGMSVFLLLMLTLLSI